MPERQGWLAVVQDGDGNEETELVTIEGGLAAGSTIELTSGQRITLLEPAGEKREEVAA